MLGAIAGDVIGSEYEWVAIKQKDFKLFSSKSTFTDSATLACIAGGIAEAYYKTIPQNILCETRSRLPEDFLKVIDRFYSRYMFKG